MKDLRRSFCCAANLWKQWIADRSALAMAELHRRFAALPCGAAEVAGILRKYQSGSI
jgi:hypothetical protein